MPNRRPPLINFAILSIQDILIPTPHLLIIGESFQIRQTFWNNLLMLSFWQSRKKNVPIFIVFCFVSSCKEANTLCFVFQVSIKKPIYCHSHKTKIQKPNQQKLQKPSKSSTSKEHLEALTRRLSLWNEGKINELLYEGQTIQDRLKAPENAPKTS